VSQTLFLFISALGLAAALGTVLSRNLVHAALHLIGFFFVVACQFVLLEAEFLAAIQVLVYIGAVAILMMFGIMLTRNVQGDDTTTLTPFWTLPAVAVGLALFLVLCVGIKGRMGQDASTAWKASQARPLLAATPEHPAPPQARAVNNMGKAIGDEMMTRYVIPFEVAGLLLTAALVGAIALAHHEGDDEPELMRRRAVASGRLGMGPGTGNGNGTGQGVAAEALAPPVH
jgi:NADH:ubiquinone oxidoreductase subunit 6 (subunit J)